MYCPLEHRSVLSNIATRYGFDPVTLDALIQHESKWNIAAVGDSGLAIGLGQMHPTACETIGVNPAMRGKSVASDLDYAAHYLRWNVNRFEGLNVDALRFGLMAYNQGPTAIMHGLAYANAVYALEASI